MVLRVTLAIAVAVLILGIGYGLYYSIGPQTTMAPTSITSVTIGTTTIEVQIADTEAEREQGLSDRASLAPNSGMLFVFQQPTTPGFWMKDMNFSLDMLFIDQNGNIVTLDQNLPPSSYNRQDPQSSVIYYPRVPIEYVLEIPAGFAAAHGIAEGQLVTFNTK